MSIGLEQLLSNRTDIDAALQKHKSPITVMFTDLAGSTSFFEHFGDTVGIAWLEEHNQIVIPTITKHQGVVVKTIGDSVMAYFTDAKQATAAGAAILNGLLKENAKRNDSEQMNVRVALHHGLGYLRGGDVFGDVVNVAARIAKTCLPSQILVSEAVYLSANEGSDLKFQPVGAVQFHGKSSKENLFEVLWTDDATYEKIRLKFPPKKQVTPQDDFTGGRYIMMNELGRGAMGVVYKAFDKLIGRPVALKTIPLEVEESQRAALVDRLKAEARTAGILDHPNIVTVFDVGEEAGLFYFTMQLVDGRTLSQIKESKDLLPLDKLFVMADEMCAAMAFAHKNGVIHRDLKPSNMMVTSTGAIKVMDFGIAKLGDSGLTKAGIVLGTPSYLAPEQAGGRRIDHRADIFSLGAVLYEMFTGEKAFAGENTTTIIYKVMNDDPIPPWAIEPALPPGLDPVIRKALAKDPNKRYQSCEELREALRTCRTNPTVHVAPEPARNIESTVAIPQPTKTAAKARPQQPPPARGGSMGWIMAAVMFVILGGGAFYMWQKTVSQSQAASPGLAAGGTSTAEPQRASAPPPATDTRQAATSVPEAASNTPADQVISDSKTRKNRLDRGPAAPDLSKLSNRRAAKEALMGISSPLVSAPVPPPAADSGGGQMWGMQDVPNLMAKADGYAGRGEYQKAIYLYEQILKVDPQNRAARDGLQRAKEARNLKR